VAEFARIQSSENRSESLLFRCLRTSFSQRYSAISFQENIPMRLIRGIVVSACAVWSALSVHQLAFSAEQFPYTAYCNSDDIYVRSGPGKNYYPTEKLSKGAAVEIYRHDPGGWYAIRPPEGSFSWVPADALKPTGNGLAVVVKDRTSCFV